MFFPSSFTHWKQLTYYRRFIFFSCNLLCQMYYIIPVSFAPLKLKQITYVRYFTFSLSFTHLRHITILRCLTFSPPHVVILSILSSFLIGYSDFVFYLVNRMFVFLYLSYLLMKANLILICLMLNICSSPGSKINYDRLFSIDISTGYF